MMCMSLPGKFKWHRKCVTASLYDTNKQGYEKSLTVSCFYDFSKEKKNLD